MSLSASFGTYVVPGQVIVLAPAELAPVFLLGIREPTAGHSTSEAVSLKCQVEGNNLVCPCDTEEKLSL